MRHDFAFLLKEHIEEHGGIDKVLSRLPDGECGARSLVHGVYNRCSEFGVCSYKQYFLTLGTLVHYEII